MASLSSQVPVGTIAEFVNRFGRFGGSEEYIRQLNGNDGLMEDWVGDLVRRLNPSINEPVMDTTNLVHRLYTGLGDQVGKIRQWNEEFGWGFTSDDLTEAEDWIGPNISIWPADRLTVVTLVPYLPDKDKMSGMERTFQDLWKVAAKQQKSNWRWDGYDQAGPKRLRLLKGINHNPGLHWEVINLGANHGETPKDVRSAKDSPHAGILASAALHPHWVRQMDGANVPFVFAPGYEVNVPDFLPWRGVPGVWFDRGYRQVGLDCRWYEDQGDRWAVPVFVRE